MIKWSKYFIPSKTSPRNGRRGCLCRDRDAYSIKCCNCDIIAQGIGSTMSKNDRYFITFRRYGDFLLQENNFKIEIIMAKQQLSVKIEKPKKKRN